MQKSPKTSRMQNSYWVNYNRPVSMIRLAAAMRGQPLIASAVLRRWQQ